jgi:hypothetical protein
MAFLFYRKSSSITRARDKKAIPADTRNLLDFQQ